jgi:hypothetical protein
MVVILIDTADLLLVVFTLRGADIPTFRDQRIPFVACRAQSMN